MPGVLAYGPTREQAITAVQALALRVMADRVENGEALPRIEMLFTAAAPTISP